MADAPFAYPPFEEYAAGLKAKTRRTGHVVVQDGYVLHTLRGQHPATPLAFSLYRILQAYRQDTGERVPVTDVPLGVLADAKAKSLFVHKARFGQ